MTDLYRRSIEIILANQHASGAYVACPNFPTYRYCWFRDASFVAYAMDRVGEHASAARFHAWAARAVNQRADVVQRALARAAAGEPLAETDVLHTRLTLAGEDGTQVEWANFQLDGFGTWLWALNEHARLSGEALRPEWLRAAGLAADYLAGLWRRPNYDCWEEFGNAVHPYTLAAIYGGLSAISGQPSAVSEQPSSDNSLSSVVRGPSSVVSPQTLSSIRDFITDHFVYAGHFVKFGGEAGVDASLLGLAVPYGVFAPDDRRVAATVAAIEATLRRGASGVRRYARDTYYGGGEWILLTAWLGWYYAACGEREKVAAILSWIEAEAEGQGNLPEQVPNNLNDPSYYPQWVAHWGPIASPLLWSHAKYVILRRAAEDLAVKN